MLGRREQARAVQIPYLVPLRLLVAAAVRLTDQMALMADQAGAVLQQPNLILSGEMGILHQHLRLKEITAVEVTQVKAAEAEAALRL